MSHLYDLVPKCDLFISICGSYWFNRISTSPFKSWKSKMFQVDLGLERNQYPFIKKKINKKNKRKFIYIGNDYAYNNFAKNLIYLRELIYKVGSKNFASAGNKQILDETHYGWLDFTKKSSIRKIEKYDFLLQTSKNDANPTTVLEAISWGLIPIITKGCGYTEFNKNIYLPSDNIKKAINSIQKLQKLDEKTLRRIQNHNIKILKNKFNWKIFRKRIRQIILKKKLNKAKVKYTKNEIKFFKYNLKNSPNYYLKYEILFSILKSNLKRIFFIF